jgi:PPK2 family polyphosphate:nucleotide phosphotransferase
MGERNLRQALAVAPGPVELSGYDSGSRPLAPTEHNRDLRTDTKRLSELQEALWAESTAGGRRSVLLVLQGMDTSGKGGVTEHVVGACGPIGVQYTAFKKPTEQELAHDFLWRIRRRLPAPGVIGVFDRSHYEDVLVPRVHGLVPEAEWRSRYDAINEFEAGLVAGGTTVLKIFLHLGFDTQRERLLARLDNPAKHWKFNEADIDERARWSEYQAAYAELLERCNPPQAPWYVVPADHKKYRNWAVGELLRETLEELAPQYPQPALEVERLKARLQPPH